MMSLLKRMTLRTDELFRRPLVAAGGVLAVLTALSVRPRVAADESLFTVVSTDEAWRRLPPAPQGQGEPLPVWARIVAGPLPRTAAAMLEMDRVQRTESTLDPLVRAKLRWVAAVANDCAYAREYAAADFLRCGGLRDDLLGGEQSRSNWPQRERLAADFVAQLSRRAFAVTDDDVRHLHESWSHEEVAAMVLLAAYSGFQDRLLQVLKIDVEPEGPLPPPRVKFDWTRRPSDAPPPTAERAIPEPLAVDATIPTEQNDPDWRTAPVRELRRQLESQQTRQPRVPLPPIEVVERNIPPGLYPPGMARQIVWNRVTFGYQPKLAAAWIFTLRRFKEDVDLPDDFRQSVFWVVTRSNQCFY